MIALRLLLCALLLFPVLQARSAPADDVEARLREFYAFYCHSLNASQDLLIQPARLKPYVSARILKQLDRMSKTEYGIEADPFVCAQDSDPAWEKNIKIAHVQAAADGKTASADVTLGGQKQMVRHLKVSLVNEGGTYKVDRVKDADLKP